MKKSMIILLALFMSIMQLAGVVQAGDAADAVTEGEASLETADAVAEEEADSQVITDGDENKQDAEADLAITAVFMESNKQKLVMQDGTEEYLPTIWIYYNNGTFEQFAVLPDGEDVLFSTGDYSLAGGGFADQSAILTLHRTQKYKDGVGLADYESIHDYEIGTLDFFRVFPKTSDADKQTPASAEEQAEQEEQVEQAQDIQYVLYLGTNDKDTNEPVFAPEEAKQAAKDILVRHFGGYTIQEAEGGWLGDDGTLFQEYTLIIHLSDTNLEAVHNAADEMLEVFRQSSVLIQANETATEFYSGAAE